MKNSKETKCEKPTNDLKFIIRDLINLISGGRSRS